VTGRVLSRFSLGLPLVVLELIQMASRRRTYLRRVLILLEVPVLVIFVLSLAVEAGRFLDMVSSVQIAIGFLVILIISVRGSTLFSGERSRQTLEILLSTPLCSRDLVRQKYFGVQRLLLVLSVPLLTAVAFATY